MRLRRRDSLAALALSGILLATTGSAILPPSRPAGLDAPPASRVAVDNAAKPYRLDLADRNDFVAQMTFVQCVGASMQMMLNIRGGSVRRAATQVRPQTLARSLSGPTRDGF